MKMKCWRKMCYANLSGTAVEACAITHVIRLASRKVLDKLSISQHLRNTKTSTVHDHPAESTYYTTMSDINRTDLKTPEKQLALAAEGFKPEGHLDPEILETNLR